MKPLGSHAPGELSLFLDIWLLGHSNLCSEHIPGCAEMESQYPPAECQWLHSSPHRVQRRRQSPRDPVPGHVRIAGVLLPLTLMPIYPIKVSFPRHVKLLCDLVEFYPLKFTLGKGIQSGLVDRSVVAWKDLCPPVLGGCGSCWPLWLPVSTLGLKVFQNAGSHLTLSHPVMYLWWVKTLG